MATLRGFDTNLVCAANSLGATPIQAFFKVTLPIIAPGVISGALFAFATSFDEVVVALFKASQCRDCPLRGQCTDAPTRTVVLLMDEEAQQKARDLADTDAFQMARARRKKIEMLFVHLKRWLKLTRLRLRGLPVANEEFLLAATAQNLKRLVKLVPI